MLRILHVCHNDPRLHAGGTEIVARELYEELARRDGVDGVFLAGTNELHRARRPGTAFQTVGRGGRDMLMWSGGFDQFNLVQADVGGVFTEFVELLRDYRPQVVHFHHLLLVGVEAIFAVRRALPEARIVVSLHDYTAICHREGVMVRRDGGTLCREATPDACTGCFPEIPRGHFKLRDVNIRTHFRLVDAFLAPSRFLRDRYVAWGIAPERIRVLRNGRALPPPAPPRAVPPGGRRDAFAVFGNLSPMKGTLVALQAAQRLAAAGGPAFSLAIHGSPEFQTDAFRKEIAAAVDGCGGRAMVTGRYRADDVPALVAGADWVVVPSVWWENAPLVIQEAFHHGRPVLCSDIGGMAEAVTDGVDGLHFRMGDAAALAGCMRRAIEEDGLWDRLRAGMAPARSVAACADEHLALYEELRATAA
ncbi:glycosyltransferase family 4 protein [Azospirillum sp.]|uniref:glycosyltransferase family 4 protein n=1 Tax=Azospirillum sp. TaxID=34012 RepID=UPI002D47B137|nr:glycosyltransferase family 4 protein [Azospirillum sp.]HYD66706.1 glycosyltransferase family 4 protein [Azospirillum sp.]